MVQLWINSAGFPMMVGSRCLTMMVVSAAKCILMSTTQ